MSEFSVYRMLSYETAKRAFRTQRYELSMMNKAHGKMLVKQGYLSLEDYRQIAHGIDQVLATMTEEDIRPQQSDLYGNMTDQLYAVVGKELGEKIHMGRSRNDMGCTFRRMTVRKSISGMAALVLKVMETLLGKAEENLDTIMTFYTFGQPAQPGTLGYYYLWVFESFSRDFQRLAAAYANANRCAMGAAAGIGTNFNLDRQYVSDALGFDSVIENTMDAITSPDYLLEVESAYANMMSSLSRIAQDMFFWASSECGILHCDSTISEGSTIMPQKNNPCAIELLRAKTGHAIGLLNEGLALMRNTSFFPNIENSREMFHIYDAQADEVEAALRLFLDVLDHSSINREKAYQMALDSFTGASTAAEYIAEKYDLPFTRTHHVIGDMIRKLMQDGTLEAKYLTSGLLADASEKVFGKRIVLSDKQVQQLIDPKFCLECKITGGTPKHEDSVKMLSQCRTRYTSQKAWLDRANEKVAHAYAALNSEV